MKIGFFLYSNRRTGSTRIAALRPAAFLERNYRYTTEILYEPPGYYQLDTNVAEKYGSDKFIGDWKGNIVFFQHTDTPTFVELAKRLRKGGVKTVYSVCDNSSQEMAEACNCTITVSDFLKSTFKKDIQHSVHVVHDAYENDRGLYKKEYNTNATHINTALITHANMRRIPFLNDHPESVPEGFNISVFGCYGVEFPHDLPFKKQLKWLLGRIVRNTVPVPQGFMSLSSSTPPWMDDMKRNVGFKRIPWTESIYNNSLVNYDVGIVPIDGERPVVSGIDIRRKSANRPVAFMALGVPVIASPHVPEYLQVIDNGRNGFLAESPNEWKIAFEYLRNPKHRKEIGRSGRERVIDEFSIEEQAERYAEIFDSI